MTFLPTCRTEPTRGSATVQRHARSRIVCLEGNSPFAVVLIATLCVKSARAGFRRFASASYTAVCLRAQTPPVKLPVIHGSESLHFVVRSAGASVHGEGECKVCQHGYSKRRNWHQVHLALAVNSDQLLASRHAAQRMSRTAKCCSNCLTKSRPEGLSMPLVAKAHTTHGPVRRDHPVRRDAVDSASRRRSSLIAYYVRNSSSRRGYRRHCSRHSRGVEAAKRLPPSFAGRERDVPVPGARGPVSVGMSYRYPSDRSCRSRRRIQPHGRTRSPAVRPHTSVNRQGRHFVLTADLCNSAL